MFSPKEGRLNINEYRKVMNMSTTEGISKKDLDFFLEKVKDAAILADIEQFFLKDVVAFKKTLESIDVLTIKVSTERERNYRRIKEGLDRLILNGELLTLRINNPAVVKKIKAIFRSNLEVLFYQGTVSDRGYKKPRGYAGDYKIIEMFYDQKNYAREDWGYYFDRYALSNPLAKADIGRKDKMVELLRKYIANFSGDKIKIINFGCGGCKELRDLFANYRSQKELNIVAVDQDREALNFSRSCAGHWGTNVKVQFKNLNVVELIKTYRHQSNPLPFRNNDLVYSIGLVDYFADNVLKLFFKFSLSSLRKNGSFIVAHKNYKRWKSFLAADWLCDWHFFDRTKDEVLDIIRDEIKGCDLKVEWERSRHMFFLIITKK